MLHRAGAAARQLRLVQRLSAALDPRRPPAVGPQGASAGEGVDVANRREDRRRLQRSTDGDRGEDAPLTRGGDDGPDFGVELGDVRLQ